MRVDDILKSVGLDGTNDGNRVPAPPSQTAPPSPLPKMPEPVMARPAPATPQPATMPQQPWPPAKPE
jgi:hypothetical protein